MISEKKILTTFSLQYVLDLNLNKQLGQKKKKDK